MIKQLSTHMTSFLLSENVISEEDGEIYEYGIKKILEYIVIVFIALITAVLIKRLPETIGFFSTFLPIRAISGGYHANSKWRCHLIMISVYVINMFVNSHIDITKNWLVFGVIASCTITLKFVFAPVDHKNNRFGQSEYVHKKKLSRLLIIAIIVSLLLCRVLIDSTHLINVALQGSLTASLTVMIGYFLKEKVLKNAEGSEIN